MKKMIGIIRNLLNREPSLHRCPGCGAGLSRLRVFSGGINNQAYLVSFHVGCLDCGHLHKIRGDNAYNRYVWCVASK